VTGLFEWSKHIHGLLAQGGQDERNTGWWRLA